MSTVNDQFASVFSTVPVPPSTTETTDVSTALTLYVKPRAVVTEEPPLGLVNFDAQGDAITKEKLKHNKKNTISAYVPKL